MVGAAVLFFGPCPSPDGSAAHVEFPAKNDGEPDLRLRGSFARGLVAIRSGSGRGCEGRRTQVGAFCGLWALPVVDGMESPSLRLRFGRATEAVAGFAGALSEVLVEVRGNDRIFGGVTFAV